MYSVKRLEAGDVLWKAGRISQHVNRTTWIIVNERGEWVRPEAYTRKSAAEQQCAYLNHQGEGQQHSTN